MGESIGKKVFFLLLAAYLVVSAFPAFADDKPLTKLGAKRGPPPGFEDLDAPRDTTVDVSYGGNRIGSFRAVFTAKSIVFANPAEIVAKIPSLKHEAVDDVTKALTGELPAHADLVCGTRIRTPGCGEMKPDVAGVIFNDQSFHADVFLNKTLLAVQDTHTEKILPPSETGFSAVHTINGGMTGTAGQNRLYSLVDNSTIAYGTGRLNVLGIASDHRQQINRLVASLDRWGLDNKVGFFDSNPMQLLPQVPMAGVSVGTSLNTNLALRQASGSRLSVFLPQRAWVSLIYNDIIYSTDFYEAGNQVLNTDALPEGVYDVTVRIRDAGGAQTEEKHFFAKHFEIPPEDTPIYFAEAGRVRDQVQNSHLPGFGNEFISRFGTVRRLNESTGYTANLLGIDKQCIVETGGFLLLPPDHQIRFSVLGGTQKDFGYGAFYIGRLAADKISIAGSFRDLHSGKDTPTLLASTSTSQVDPITEDSRELSASTGYQATDKLNVGAQANYTQQGHEGKRYAVGPTMRYDFWRNGQSSLSLTADSSKTQNGLVHAVFLRYSLRLGPWGYTADGGLRAGDRTDLGGSRLTRTADGRITWNDDKQPGRLTIIGAETRHDDTSTSYIADVDHRGNFGNLKLIGSRTSRDNGPGNTFYSGNFGFSVAQTPDQVIWGGNQQTASGVIINSTGNSEDVPMKVLVNNSEQMRIKTGESNTMFLSPYQTYNIHISPADPSAVDYDGSIKEVTLYPGNIMPLSWDINKVFVVLGHVILPDGTPLIGATLEEARNLTVSDDDGLFQAELLSLSAITFRRDVAAPRDEFAAPPSPGFPNMTDTAQAAAIIDLFSGEPVDDSWLPFGSLSPVEAMADAVENMSRMDAQAMPPLHPPLPPVQCRVTLPQAKAVNGVTIYYEPLVCRPLTEQEVLAGRQVQLGAYPSEEAARKEWEAMQAAHSELKGREPVITQADVPGKGTFWRVRVGGFANGKEAYDFCRNMTQQKQECVVPDDAPPAEPVMLHEPEAAPEEDSVPPAPPEPARQQDVSVEPEYDAIIGPPAVATLIIPEALQVQKRRVFAVRPPEPEPAVQNHAVVQLGAFRSENEAKQEWAQMASRYGELAGRMPHFIRADLGERGVFYRVRLNDFADAGEAQELCSTLTSKGQDCILPMKD